MFELDVRAQVDVVADCQALQVGQFRVRAGENRTFQNLDAAAAFVFHEGEGTINIEGHSHVVAAATAELVCPGETCTISAVEDIHAFLIVCKDRAGTP